MIDLFYLKVNEPDKVIIFLFVLSFLSFLLSLYGGLKRNVNQSLLRKNLLIFFNSLCFIALLGFIFEPHIKNNHLETIRLVTQSFSHEIEPTNYPELTYLESIYPESIDPEYTYYESILPNHGQLKNLNNKTLLTPHQLLIRHPNIQRLEVIGDGLSEKQWEAFHNIQIDYNRPKKLIGFVDTTWNKQLNQGDFLQVSGRFQYDKKEVLNLRLLNPAGEVEIEKKILANEFFQLTTQPKAAGLHQYKIEVYHLDGQRMADEILHVSVTKKTLIKVLVMQSAPSFETKQLQNWIAEHGGQVLTKTKISQERYLTQKINIAKPLPSEKITDLFKQFDLLVIDGRGLTELSHHEQEQLEQAIKKGLGMIVLADTTLMKNNNSQWPAILSGMFLQKKDNTKALSLIPNWKNSRQASFLSTELLALTLSAKIKIDNHNIIGFKPLVWTDNNEVLVAKKQLGRGRVALSLIKNTYAWVTAGQQNAHSHYWQNQIKNIARYRNQIGFIPVNEPFFHWAKQLTQVCFIGENVTEVSVRRLDKQQETLQTLLMQHDFLIEKSARQSKRYCGRFWPKKAGWYQAEVIGKKASSFKTWFYVESLTHWKTAQQQEKVRATLNKQASYNHKKIRNFSPIDKPINPWYFWWLLIISVSFLWIEKKFN